MSSLMVNLRFCKHIHDVTARHTTWYLLYIFQSSVELLFFPAMENDDAIIRFIIWLLFLWGLEIYGYKSREQNLLSKLSTCAQLFIQFS